MAYFHVCITHQLQKSKRGEVKLDLSREELLRRVVEPYDKGQPITINGKTMQVDSIERVKITTTDQDSTYFRSIVQQNLRARGFATSGAIKSHIANNVGKDVTDEFITGPSGSELEVAPESSHESRTASETQKVFVVHGRNSKARNALFGFLQSIGLHPLEWSEAVRSTGKASPYIGEILDAAFLRAQAVVVLFTPDDEARLREPFQGDNEPLYETQLTGQARPNVLFEAGMAMARHQDRTILVELGTLRSFSDIAGLHVIRMNDSSQRRQELAQRLEAAGCPVNLEGIAWHTAGGFEAAVEQSVQLSSDSTAIDEQQSTLAEFPQLSEDVKELLIEATNDRARMITIVKRMGRVEISSNGKDFVEMGSRRSEARWEQAVRDLLDQGLVKDLPGRDDVFEVTHKGFQIADALGNS